MLPVELYLCIADHIKDRWQRDTFVKAVNIDHLYYKGRGRPLPKWTSSFIPRKYDPMTLVRTHANQVSLYLVRVHLPLKNAEKSYMIQQKLVCYDTHTELSEMCSPWYEFRFWHEVR